MNNPNGTLDEPEDISLTSTTEVEEAAPRSYVAAGVVAALAIVLACVIGIAILSGGVLTARQNPTPTPGKAMKLEVVNGIEPNAPFSVRGSDFAANERVSIYVGFAPGATFDQFVKVGEAQSGTDGSFELAGLNLPPPQGDTVYLLAHGEVSGFSPIFPITLGGVPIQATGTLPAGETATLAPLTPTTLPTNTPPPTPLPQEPTYTPSPAPPTNTPSPSATPDPNRVGVWFGRYYDNPDLGDPPVFQREDANLNFNWHSGSPGSGIPNDNFSAMWTRNEDFRTTDNYVFTLVVDDGARVYLDNNLIINEWRNGGARTVKASRGVNRGIHQIRVEYYEATGNAQLSLSWAVKYIGWVGRYYNTPDLSGPIVLKRDDVTAGDPFIDFGGWGFGSPAPEVNPDNFSVDWTRTVNFPIAGTYVFTAVVDDGVRLYIDGSATPVFDNFGSSGSRTIVGTAALSAGQHALEVQYVERTGQAKIQLNWALAPQPPTSTPTNTPVTPSTEPPTITPIPSDTPTPPPASPTPTPTVELPTTEPPPDENTPTPTP